MTGALWRFGHDLSNEPDNVKQAYKWLRKAADEDPAEREYDALWTARVFACFFYGGDLLPEEVVERVRLSQAAPAMLEALRYYADLSRYKPSPTFAGHGGEPTILAVDRGYQARQAIAQAEGKNA